jgi:threonine dehydrogenase-like Zn-dependent dehydrogenase
MEARAMVLEKYNEPLVLRTFPIPKLGEGEVLAEVLAAGVCGSDVHQWEGRDPRLHLPLILGHEGAGEIAEICGKKKDIDGHPLRAGDRVLWSRSVSCGRCYYCTVKREPSLCPDRWVYGIHTTCAGPPHLTGNYSEYLLLDSRTDLFRIDPGVDLKALVPASCSGATAAHAFDLAPFQPGDTVVILGGGPLGIFSVAFARARGASEIIVIGGTPGRLRMCERFGATRLLDRHRVSQRDREERVMEITHGRGADVTFEMAGEPEAVKECIALTRTGGACVSAGFGEPHGKIELDCFHDIVRRNLHLQGVWVSDARHTHMALQLMLGRMDDFKRLTTHTFPLERANDAIRVMKTREAVKAVLLPHETFSQFAVHPSTSSGRTAE